MGTGVETRGQILNGNKDWSADRNKSSSGDGDGDGDRNGDGDGNGNGNGDRIGEGKGNKYGKGRGRRGELWYPRHREGEVRDRIGEGGGGAKKC